MKTISNPIVTYLNELSIFNALDSKDRANLAVHTTRKVIPKYTSIYEAGQPSDSIYFLVRGTVKIGRSNNDEREVIKRIMYPGSMFGELVLFGEQKRLDFAMTMNQESEIFIMDARVVERMMRHNHELALNMLNWIGRRLRHMESKLESMVFKDARARIIEFLKESAENVGRKVGYETLIKHALTQQDIANITGTSRQTVTAVLNELRNENLIHFNRRNILIRDLSKLS
jgi:CRP/FNR family cyclic AMP-dependent transcriptional regulator